MTPRRPLSANLLLAILLVGILVPLRPQRPPAWLRAEAELGRTELRPARMGIRDLRRLPGVGERLALRALRARRHAVGRLSWSDVHGIGPRTTARIRAWLAARGGEPEALLSEDASSGDELLQE